jgi:integrase
LAAAKDWAKKLEQDLRKQKIQGEVSPDLTKLTVEKLIDDFLDDPNTQKLRYHSTLSIWLAWWANEYGKTKVLDLNVELLREAREKIQKGRKPATVNRCLSALRSCWNWGRGMGFVPQDRKFPTRIMLKEDNTRQRYLSDAELERLLEAAAAHSPTMYAAIVLSVACGLRQGELLNLKWQDIDLGGQRLSIMQTKTDQPRTVYIPASAVDALRALKRESLVSTKCVFLGQGDEPLNRGTVRIRWITIRDAAGLRDFRWHDLRHSCASFLAAAGATLLEIGAVLGHRSLAATFRYAHLVEGEPVKAHAALDAKLQGK